MDLHFILIQVNLLTTLYCRAKAKGSISDYFSSKRYSILAKEESVVVSIKQ